MSEANKQENTFSQIRKDYEKLKPVIDKAEKMGGSMPGMRRIARRSAFIAGREKQQELEEANERIQNAERMVGKDSLTGVSNKEKFIEELFKAIKIHLRLDRPLSVFMMDLDDFKDVNDSFGHLVGDIVIKDFANLISSEVRGIDVIGRFGGDEFALILPGTAEEYAKTAGEKLRNAVKNKLLGRVSENLPGRDYPFTISIGATSFYPNSRGKTDESTKDLVNEIIEEADIALYNSKRNTNMEKLKDRITFYQKGMTIPNATKVHTEIET